MNRVMTMRRIAFVLVLVFSLGATAGAEEAADAKAEKASNFDYQTVTTKEGLVFRVPEDMPIETRNGITAPISFDEYIYGKFKLMDARLQSMEAKLDRLEAMLAKIVGPESGSAAPLKSGVLLSKPKTQNGESKK